MQFISRVDDAYAWMKSKGVYRQVDLFHRGEVLFAKWGSGYIRLSVSGTTSNPNITWLELDPGSGARLLIRDGHVPILQSSFSKAA